MFSPHTRGCSFFRVPPPTTPAVFPAYAGMFRRTLHLRNDRARFPRIRGDVPVPQWKPKNSSKFSPHTRGCSFFLSLAVVGGGVFPAYAGMFRILPCRPWIPITFSPHTRGCSAHDIVRALFDHVFPAYAGMFRAYIDAAGLVGGFPRIRGDVPHILPTMRPTTWFSPHTRGCSRDLEIASFIQDVFPAYAGMFLQVTREKIAPRRFPRIRGDVPAAEVAANARGMFSPHTRGCSEWLPGSPTRRGVFPAYAGMFLRISGIREAYLGFPRIRGDVPGIPRGHDPVFRFSPHTRGCSYRGLHHRCSGIVFPAYAGMFPMLTISSTISSGFPRIRGDVPWSTETCPPRIAFSPHTRGCSAWSPGANQHQGVFPAYAGMFPKPKGTIRPAYGFPRIRGDVPDNRIDLLSRGVFSPHTRGCSLRVSG